MRAIYPLLLAGVFAGCESGAPTIVPLMPNPQFAPKVYAGEGLSNGAIRRQIETVLPAGVTLLMGAPTASPAAPGGGPPSIVNGRPAMAAEPVPTVAISGQYPVINLADENYALLAHEYVPVLLDWFDDLTKTLGAKQPVELRNRGLLANKVARLMRVFTTVRMHRENEKDRDRTNDIVIPPAIGWCRLFFKEDWGTHRKGETYALLLIGTDQGWFVIDPYTRYMRQLLKNDPLWIPQFIVM